MALVCFPIDPSERGALATPQQKLYVAFNLPITVNLHFTEKEGPARRADWFYKGVGILRYRLECQLQKYPTVGATSRTTHNCLLN